MGRRQSIAVGIVTAAALLVACPADTDTNIALTAPEAIAAAVAAEPKFADYNVTVRRHVQAGELHPSFIAEDVPAEREVWYLVFDGGSTGAFAIVDYYDGAVLEIIETIE